MKILKFCRGGKIDCKKKKKELSTKNDRKQLRNELKIAPLA